MNYKPVPLLILAFLHFIEPITKLVFYGLFYNVSPIKIAEAEINSGGLLQSFQFFFLFPIAGFAIYQVKRWSFNVFLIIEAWVIFANLNYYKGLYKMGHYGMLAFWIAFAVINIGVVAYILLPAVRIAYLDPRVRWWEAKPRYQVKFPCRINGEHEGQVNNISESGLFILENEKLELGSPVKISFSQNDMNFELDSMVIHKFELGGQSGFGVKFIDLLRENKKRLKNLCKVYESNNVERRPPKRKIFSDMKKWFKSFSIAKG